MRSRGSKPKHARKNDGPPPEPAPAPEPRPKLGPPLDMNHEMAKKHEAFLVRIFGGRLMKGSGNKQSGQMDGRHDAHTRSSFAFAWDGKSTLGASVLVSKRMWEKACEQSHFERPMLALRYYANFRLQDSEALDLVVVSAHDQAELLDRLEELEKYWADTHVRNTSTVTTTRQLPVVPAAPTGAGPGPDQEPQ
jgi:hypothetical protein